MDKLLAEFFTYKPSEQVHFLREPRFAELEESVRVEFLQKILLAEKISSKTMAAALKELRGLKFRNRNFYKKFANHPDSSVAMAAKKAMTDTERQGASDFFQMREMVKKQNREKRLEAVQQVMAVKDLPVEDLLISFLAENDLKVRELIIRDLSQRPQVDEQKLCRLLARSPWFIKSAFVEILGNRHSELLLEKLDDLVRDPNAEVRLKVVGALARFNRERVETYLVQLTHDAHAQVRREAQQTLARV